MVSRRSPWIVLFVWMLGLVAGQAGAAGFPVLDDASTNAAAPQQRLGSAPVVAVDADHVGYVRFDLSPLPPGSVVEKATLSVFVETINAGGSIAVHRVDGPWAEDNLTYTARPALGPALPDPLVLAADAHAHDSATVDVTAAVQAWLAGTPNHGLALVGDGTVQVELGSKEKPDDGHPMVLQIVLVPSAPND